MSNISPAHFRSASLSAPEQIVAVTKTASRLVDYVRSAQHTSVPFPDNVGEALGDLSGDDGVCGPKGESFGSCIVSWFQDVSSVFSNMFASVTASLSAKFSALGDSLSKMFSALRSSLPFSMPKAEDAKVQDSEESEESVSEEFSDAVDNSDNLSNVSTQSEDSSVVMVSEGEETGSDK